MIYDSITIQDATIFNSNSETLTLFLDLYDPHGSSESKGIFKLMTGRRSNWDRQKGQGSKLQGVKNDYATHSAIEHKLFH